MRRYCITSALAALTLSLIPAAQAQHGIILSGAGPINRAMGGAASAPLDSIGALYWHPATITNLPSSELAFGGELLFPRSRLTSTMPAGALGPGIPPVTLSDSTKSDSGYTPLPSVGLVYRPGDSVAAYGLGFYAVGGFGVNYPASATNPLLTPQLPGGVGMGAIASDLQILELAPTVAIQITDRLSFGFGPVLSMAHLIIDPMVMVPPDDANADGFVTYPAATHSRWHWGAGFNLGFYYATESCWHFTTSFKSPRWFESFRFNSADELGRPRRLKVHFDLPWMISVGAAYSGWERLVLAADCRFIDYHNTEGFDSTGYDPTTAAVKGLGWDSVFVVALGAQYQLTDPLAVRLGYSFNTNPIDDANTSFNVAAPVVIQHTAYCGFSYEFTDTFLVSLAYAHAFANSTSGLIVTPLGAIPGSLAQQSASADTFMFGATVRY